MALLQPRNQIVVFPCHLSFGVGGRLSEGPILGDSKFPMLICATNGLLSQEATMELEERQRYNL